MLTEGMTIAERYEVIEKIGTGGMSDVYKAKDLLLGRFVAVKVLKTEFSEDTNFLAKFRTEAQAAAGLEHPNIVNIYDVGSENKMHYIIMEYVEGITLKTYIEKRVQIGCKEAISIAIQTANGIRAAHNKKIVHRDIKPQNIMISTEGKVKVTDFGIARATTTNTINSEVMGSVHYISPEQARNGYVDIKSDVYSLGVVMYEMVTGRVPFDGESAVSVALQHLQEEIVRPSAFAPELPVSLEKIILKCTQKSPDRRYQSMDDLIVDLKKAAMNPDDDFVDLDSAPVQQAPQKAGSQTKAITAEELEKISELAKNRDEQAEMEENKNNEDIDFENGEDDGDEQSFLNPKMEKIVTIAGIVAAVFLVVVIVLILGTIMNWFKFGSGKDPEKNNNNDVIEDTENKIELDDLRGKTFEEAKAILNEKGLGIQLQGTELNDEYEEGQIISQSEEPGTMLDKNTTIQVIVCAGKEGFELPDVVNSSEVEATGLLQAAPYSLVVSVSYEFSSEVEVEKVISTSPKAGETVHAGDTITLIVSRGSETVEVPGVLGQKEEDAKKALKEASFQVSVETAYSDTVEVGRVISQSIDAHKEAVPGSSIKIVVSLGKEVVEYQFKYTINAASDEEKDGVTYVVKSAFVELYVDDDIIYDTQITSFPRDISLSGLEASKGRMEITWLYVNENDDEDVYTKIESIDVSFSK